MKIVVKLSNPGGELDRATFTDPEDEEVAKIVSYWTRIGLRAGDTITVTEEE
jgi:hypothetical protein